MLTLFPELQKDSLWKSESVARICLMIFHLSEQKKSMKEERGFCESWEQRRSGKGYLDKCPLVKELSRYTEYQALQFKRFFIPLLIVCDLFQIYIKYHILIILLQTCFLSHTDDYESKYAKSVSLKMTLIAAATFLHGIVEYKITEDNFSLFSIV